MKIESKAMPWWQAMLLLALSVLVSAVVTGSIAFIVDHILWE
jgi:hypothetical protein